MADAAASVRRRSSESGQALRNPSFAVICSFLQRYSSLLGVEEIAFDDLELHLENTKRGKLQIWIQLSNLSLNNGLNLKSLRIWNLFC